MASNVNASYALAGHSHRIESILAVVRQDHTLDDRQKGRRITQVIAAGNARAVKILISHGKLPAAG
jgi:hypothetical protein